MDFFDNIVHIGGEQWLTLEKYNKIIRNNAKIALDKNVAVLMSKSQQMLMKFGDERTPIYGLNTQFGSQVNLLDVNLTNNDKNDYHNSIKERQSSLIKSHNCGLGEDMPEEVSRGAMVLRAHCLGMGYSGVRPQTAEALIDFINKGIHPVIYRYGSIGASGDLIPLSAIAAALIGEDTKVFFDGEKISAIDALKKANLVAFRPEGREGLALINGTSFMTANAALSLYDLKRLFPQMLSAIAMSLESLMIIGGAYNPLVHELKRHKGSMVVNDFLNNFWKGNKLIQSLTDVRKENLKQFQLNNGLVEAKNGIQDYYSLRSIPQGFGVLQENLKTASEWIEDEMNSVNDNPIIDTKMKKIYQGANFMGYYVTEACDMLKMDISQASSWLHAIMSNLIHPRKNSGLPANLVSHPEINNGYRPIQILVASLAVQNRKLAQSQQAYMLPTEGDNQDVNSLAAHAAFDFKIAVTNLERITAILFLASAQALELRGINKASARAKQIHEMIREKSAFLEKDRSLNKDIDAVMILMRKGEI